MRRARVFPSLGAVLLAVTLLLGASDQADAQAGRVTVHAPRRLSVLKGPSRGPADPRVGTRSPGVSSAPEAVPELVLPLLLVGVAFQDTPLADIQAMQQSVASWSGGGPENAWRQWDTPSSIIRYWADVSRVVTGETRWPVPKESYQSRFGILPYTIPVSQGGAIRLAMQRGHYTGGYASQRFSGVGDRTNEFLQDAAATFDAQFNFATLPRGAALGTQADSSGAPFPTGIVPILSDEDATVPVVVFVQAARPGECRSAGSAGLVSHGQSFEQMTGRVYRSADLDSITEGTIRRRGPILNEYIVVSGLGCDGRPVGPARLNHEIGHLLGLPDLSRPDAASETGRTSVVGAWDLMDQGHVRPELEPLGAPLGAWSREQLGWTVPTRFTTDTSSARRLLTSNSLGSGRYLEINAGDGRTRWIIEERRRLGLDSLLAFPDGRDMGWLIWQIDEQEVTTTALSLNRLNAHAPTAPAVRVVQADGGTDLLTGARSSSGTGDLWSSRQPGDTLRVELVTLDGVKKGTLLIARRRDLTELQAAVYQPVAADDTTGGPGAPPARWGAIRLTALGVAADTLPALVGPARVAVRVAGLVGTDVELEMSFADAAIGRRATVVWSGGAELTGLGFNPLIVTVVPATATTAPRWRLRFPVATDSATGAFTIPLDAVAEPFTLTAQITVDGLTAIQTWRPVLDILSDPGLTASAVGQSITSGTALPERMWKFYDAHGNRTGSLDAFDLLALLRKGVLRTGASATPSSSPPPTR